LFSLDWLIDPVGAETFVKDYWEKQPLVVRRNQSGYFSSLLSFDDVDRVITGLDRRYPDVCLKNANDSALVAGDYTTGGGALDVARLYQFFEQGATVTLAFLDTVIPALNIMCRSLEGEFNCPVQANVYMTPPRAQGAAPHYDTHDVFVLQVAGSKRWTIFETPIESPLSGQEFDARIHHMGSPVHEFELHAGDLAYIPRGVGHEAQSTDSVSLHVTAGILRYTWLDLLLEHIAAVSLSDAAFRKALPPGFAKGAFDRTEARKRVKELLRQAADHACDAALDSLIDRFLSKCPPVLEGQFEQLARLDAITVDSEAGARPGVVYRITTGAGSESIETYGRTISYPMEASEAVRFALTRTKFVVKDLPGGLDDSGKVTLTKRLIREGLVIALSHDASASVRSLPKSELH
jgi:ribosomal protein L16 Arg81 hydroxylase